MQNTYDSVANPLSLEYLCF